jgi:hypothetical protein
MAGADARRAGRRSRRAAGRGYVRGDGAAGGRPPLQPKVRARDALRGYFTRQKRKIYLAAELLEGGARTYTAIPPRRGLYESRVLGLEIEVEEDRLRFYSGTALLLDSDELIARLETIVEEARQRAEEEARRAEDEARRAEDEARRSAEAEAEVQRLRDEIDRLKR